jgi:hypothetical protein
MIYVLAVLVMTTATGVFLVVEDILKLRRYRKLGIVIGHNFRSRT